MIKSVEDYCQETKVFNVDEIQLINEFAHGSRRSSVKIKDRIYIVDLYSQRGIEVRTRYDNLGSAKKVAEDWVLNK